jgi:hypothetical protein
MDQTRVFLLQLMAEATSLEEFYLAYRAAQNLNRLLVQAARAHPAPGVYNQQQPQPQPQAQPDFRRSEPSWGENDEHMPWEG